MVLYCLVVLVFLEDILSILIKMKKFIFLESFGFLEVILIFYL